MLYSLALAHLLQVVVTTTETALITALVSFVVIQGIKELLVLFKVDLSDQAAGITSVIVVAIVALLNGVLLQIPPALVPFADELQKLLDLLLMALGPFGLYRTYLGLKAGRTDLASRKR